MLFDVICIKLLSLKRRLTRMPFPEIPKSWLMMAADAEVQQPPYKRQLTSPLVEKNDKSKKGRVRCNPDVTTSQVAAKLESFLEEEGTRDLASMLAPLPPV